MIVIFPFVRAILFNVFVRIITRRRWRRKGRPGVPSLIHPFNPNFVALDVDEYSNVGFELDLFAASKFHADRGQGISQLRCVYFQWCSDLESTAQEKDRKSVV